jgi:hypothetical protein
MSNLAVALIFLPVNTQNKNFIVNCMAVFCTLNDVCLFLKFLTFLPDPAKMKI